MSAGGHTAVPGRVVLHDDAEGRWLQFSNPRQIITAATLPEVVAGLAEVEAAVTGGGLHAAGFVSYEAAPAFDPALTVRQGGGFPLLWFGLYDQVDEVELPDPTTAPGWRQADWQPSITSAEYYDALARIKTLIRSGDTYQVNFTWRLETVLSVPPWEFFLRLAAAQESPFSAFLDTGDWVVCSASPELFFRLDGERIECRPMKGTAARGLTLAQDRARAESLRISEKDRAENVMIVDMTRHDLGRVAQPGSVNVTSLFAVEKYPTVWQMTSTVEARTSAGLSRIFGALFPPASITGAPKVRTMEIIARLESSPRRLYTGAIGFVAPGRRAQFNVAIRTLLFHRSTCRVEYGVGGGIVWDSQPESEWRECRTKAGILEAPMPPFSLLETMLWTPAAGCFLLDRHLQRLEASALYFGFRVNLEAVKVKLEQLVSGLPPVHQKVRLLVDQDGSITLEANAFPEETSMPQRVALAAAPVDSANPFLYHKTTNRSVYETALAACSGYRDVLLYNERGEVTESTIANVAVDIEGRLVTPPVDCGLLAGTLRADLLARGELIEQPVTIAQLLRSTRVFLINSVRGMCRVEVRR
jgi:para-aminobenzoate synthetase/4-amino-4-deoxychorismate lyase